MKSDDAGLPGAGLITHQQFARRLWLQSLACGVGLSVAGLSARADVPVQASRLPDVIRAMSAMTGSELTESWVGPTASLVGVILDYSHGLRELELGEVEPAVVFLPR